MDLTDMNLNLVIIKKVDKGPNQLDIKNIVNYMYFSNWMSDVSGVSKIEAIKNRVIKKCQ